MNLTYKRTPAKSHMVIENMRYKPGYEQHMIEENDITPLLPSSRSETDGSFSYWFDVSGKISLKTFLTREGINETSLSAFFTGLSKSLEDISGFLLNPENIVFSPETVFLSDESGDWEVFFAYIPGCNNGYHSGLMSFAEYLVGNVDHDNKDIVKVCYELYQRFSEGDLEFPVFEPKMQEAAPVEEPLMEFHSRRELQEEIFREIDARIEEERPKSKLEKFLDFKIQAPEITGFINKLLKKKNTEPEIFEDFVMDPNQIPEESHRLVYLGKSGHRDIKIDKSPFRIGSRKENNDGCIEAGVISRNHARIIEEDGAFFIEDLESKNGTFINGKILDFSKKVRIKPGDKISFANIGFRFE